MTNYHIDLGNRKHVKQNNLIIMKDQEELQNIREQDYKPRKSLFVIGLWVIGLIVGMCVGDPNKDMFTVGPSETLVFAGINVNTWEKYWGVMCYALLSQCCQSYVNSNLIPWVTNVIQDHKTSIIHMTWTEVMFIRTIHLLFEWLSGVSELLFLFTMQLQFYAVLMIGDMTIKLWRTNNYINNKCIKTYSTVDVFTENTPLQDNGSFMEEVDSEKIN